MSSSQDLSSKFEKLRQQAEEMIHKQPELSSEAPSDILELIHELKIHQTELQIQNEELQRAQGELSELHREFENLYEFAPCGYLTLNAKGIISRANLTAVKLLGTSLQFLSGAGFSQYIAHDWHYIYTEARNKCIETREKQSIEIPLKTKNEEPLWVRADIEANHDESGAVTLWRIVLMDISAQRQAEEDKKGMEDRLRQAQKLESIGNLAGGIAHDFNNILSSVIGFTELALDEAVKGSTMEDSLQEVYNAGKRAKDLVMQILTFARKTNEEVKPVNIMKILQQSIDLLRSSIPSDISIKHHINCNSQVVGNPTLLEQVILNLGSNAADAMEDGGGNLEIAASDVVVDESFAADVGLLGPGNHVRIAVSDNGIGIPGDVIQSVFEPYFTTKAAGKGTGMGLATVHGTIKKYGGAIKVESQPGQGTVFTVWLPATKTSEITKPYQPDALPQGSERILFVDDEMPIVKMGNQLFERLGYRVSALTSSTEALELFQAKPNEFDLVITDMTMPNMTGDALAAELMKIRPDIPVVLCTGYSNKISDEEATELGIKAFAYKPVVKADLAKTVRKVLDEAKK